MDEVHEEVSDPEGDTYIVVGLGSQASLAEAEFDDATRDVLVVNE